MGVIVVWIMLFIDHSIIQSFNSSTHPYIYQANLKRVHGSDALGHCNVAISESMLGAIFSQNSVEGPFGVHHLDNGKPNTRHRSLVSGVLLRSCTSCFHRSAGERWEFFQITRCCFFRNNEEKDIRLCKTRVYSKILPCGQHSQTISSSIQV